MNEKELGHILMSLNAAHDIYVRHKGMLTAADIHVKSMLMVLRTQVAAQLNQTLDVVSGEPLD